MKKGVASESSLREFISTDLKRPRAHEARFNRPERRPGKIRGENFFDRLHLLRRLQQVRAPLRQNRCDLVRIFFGDEIVEPRLCLEQRGIERRLGSIVRMQVKLALCCKRAWRIKSKGKIAQACRKQRRRGSLAAADEKVAATGIGRMKTGGIKIDGVKINRMTRLPCPTQTDAP